MKTTKQITVSQHKYLQWIKRNVKLEYCDKLNDVLDTGFYDTVDSTYFNLLRDVFYDRYISKSEEAEFTRKLFEQYIDGKSFNIRGHIDTHRYLYHIENNPEDTNRVTIRWVDNSNDYMATSYTLTETFEHILQGRWILA